MITQTLTPDRSTADLAKRCAEETARYIRGQKSDRHVGFELLRRALEEHSDEAFTHAYRIYAPLVTRWVYQHSGFARTSESAEFFVSGAFRSFYFGLRGTKFARFATLAALLSYLKSCVHTEIAQYLRQQGPLPAPLEAAAEPATCGEVGRRAEADELWGQVCGLLPQERDRLLARCAFVLDLAPRQICVAYPLHWPDERAVSVALFRIRRLLRADPTLAQLAGQRPPA